jgi:hypothetical protein
LRSVLIFPVSPWSCKYVAAAALTTGPGPGAVSGPFIRSEVVTPRGQETNALHAQLFPPAKQLARVNPSGSRYLGRNSARFDRRRNDPPLLFCRPAPPPLNRRDHLNRSVRYRTSPRNSPMTSSPPSHPQGGPYRGVTTFLKHRWHRLGVILCAVISRACSRYPTRPSDTRRWPPSPARL